MAEYRILPNRRNLHGVLDPSLTPAIKVQSGDTIRFTTLEPDWRIEKPEGNPPTAQLFPRIPGRDDGHALCGPVYVDGAGAGMSLKIDIGSISVGKWGWSSVGLGNRDHLDNLGFSGEEYFRIWDLDKSSEFCCCSNGLKVPLSPFPGVLAVAPNGRKPVSTHIPGIHGGNLDCRLLGPGSTLFLPVFHEGALFSIGDGHASQGDGESGGTAIECPFNEIVVTLTANELLLESPVAHTLEGWITFGFHEDLTKAAYEALRNMRKLLKKMFNMEEKAAMTICSVAVDLRITQIVNGIRGVHAVLPKNILSLIKNSIKR